jgi:hypothetical protein
VTALHKALTAAGHNVIAEPMGSHLRAPVAAVNPETKRMRLNSEHPYWKDPEAFAEAMHESGISASPHPMHLVAHELGHLAHSLPKEHAAFEPAEATIAGKVSRYASSNKNEFLAEYVAGKATGAKYEPDVEKLYKSIAGVAK